MNREWGSGFAAGWRLWLAGEPWLTTIFLAGLFVAALLAGGGDRSWIQRFALQADQPYAVLFYWIFHLDGRHLTINVWFLTVLGGFLELGGGAGCWYWRSGCSAADRSTGYWLGSCFDTAVFPPAVGAAWGLMPWRFRLYSFLKLFHAGVLLWSGPALGAAHLDPAAAEPLYGLGLLLATSVGVFALLGDLAAGQGGGHLLGYVLGCLLAFEFWRQDLGAGAALAD